MAVTKALFAGDDPTPDSVKRRRMMADMLLAQGQDIRHVDSPLEVIGSLLQSGIGAYQSRKADQEDKAGLASRREGQNMLLDSAFGAGAGFGSATGPIGSSAAGDGRYTMADYGSPEAISTTPGNGGIYNDFIGTVSQTVKNPFGLAAVAATGKRESGYSERNAYGDWSDPSESGQAGQAGGVMSWRAERLANMRNFVASAGGDPRRPSAALQAQFFLNEDPGLIDRLNNATSVEEAQQAMNKAWAFAGWNRPGGEAAARIAAAKAYLPEFQGGSAAVAAASAPQQPVQVASLDPSAGVAEATAPQALSGPLDTRTVVERAMADQKARAGGSAAEFGAQDVATLQARPRDPQAVPYTGPGATIDARDVPALTPGNRLGDTLSPEDQAIYDERIRGRGPQPNGRPYTGPGARSRDADAMTSIAPVGLPGSSAAANAGIQAFHAGNGSTPTQYGQGAPGAVPLAPTNDLRGVLTQAVEAQKQAATPTPTPRPQATQSMAGAPSTVLVPGGDGKGPVDPAALSNSPLVRGGALPLSADPMLGGNQGALAMARQSQGGAAAGGTTMPAQPQASAGGYATELPSPPPPPIQNDQQRAALAGVLTGGQGQAPGGPPYNRAMIAQLLANPYTEDLGQAALQEVLRYRAQANKPVEYDYQSMPDGTLLRLDPRGGAPQVAYQGQQRPITLGDRLVDPSTGRVIADYSKPNTATVGGAVVDLDTGQPIYQAPREGFTLQPGETRFDGNGNTLAAGGEKPGFRQATPEEAKSYGASSGQFGPNGRFYPEDSKGRLGGVTVMPDGTVQVGGGNGTKFTEKSEEAAAKRLDDIVQGGAAAGQMLGDVQQLADLGRQIGTGLGAQVMVRLGPYAEALGVNVEGLAPAQAYQSIIARMAPQMRPAGSGASSDFDARQFLDSLPSLGNTPEGNQIIVDTFAAIQQNKLQAAEIASQAYIPVDQGGLPWQEAERRIRSLPNPYERFKATRERAGSSSAPQDTTPRQDGVPVGGSATAIERARNPQTGQVLELRNGQWVEVQ